ncbi:MAG: hypothetical protein KKI08_08300 [Armatimonadetes bacterium]|nr:hypothetical protein [Armatimonadota bacterium]
MGMPAKQVPLVGSYAENAPEHVAMTGAQIAAATMWVKDLRFGQFENSV